MGWAMKLTKAAVLITFWCSIAASSPATPIEGFVYPDHIYLGTNSKDSGGYDECKLATNKSLAVIVAGDFVRVRNGTSGQRLWDLTDAVWLTLEEETTISGFTSSVVPRFEEMLKRLTEFSYPKEKSLRGLNLRGVIAETRPHRTSFRAFTLNFDGTIAEPHIQLTFERLPATPYSFAWIGTRPMDSSKVDSSFAVGEEESAVIQHLKKVARLLRDPAFNPPFLTVYLGHGRVQPLTWNANLCESTRQGALKRYAERGPEYSPQ